MREYRIRQVGVGVEWKYWLIVRCQCYLFVCTCLLQIQLWKSILVQLWKSILVQPGEHVLYFLTQQRRYDMIIVEAYSVCGSILAR